MFPEFHDNSEFISRVFMHSVVSPLGITDILENKKLLKIALSSHPQREAVKKSEAGGWTFAEQNVFSGSLSKNALINLFEIEFDHLPQLIKSIDAKLIDVAIELALSMQRLDFTRTLVDELCSYGDFSLLVKLKARKNSSQFFESLLDLPLLHYAVKFDRSHLFTLLLEWGFNPSQSTSLFSIESLKQTSTFNPEPIDVAVSFPTGRKAIVQTLLSRDIQIEGRWKGFWNSIQNAELKELIDEHVVRQYRKVLQ